MKRYFSIVHTSENNEHLNLQDLLPAKCKLITGIAVSAIAKQDGQPEDVSVVLPFPQNLITRLLKGKQISGLFYSYLKTRPTIEESRKYFESDMLPVITSVLSENIKFSCLDTEGQKKVTQNITTLLNTKLAAYLYEESGLFEKGKKQENKEFKDFIARKILECCWKERTNVFTQVKKAYKKPKAYECGNISLLINGNSFLLRDYVITANRKVNYLSKEVILFHESLEVNSNLHTIFKSYKNSGDNTLTIRIYVEYETLTKKEKQAMQQKESKNEKL